MVVRTPDIFFVTSVTSLAVFRSVAYFSRYFSKFDISVKIFTSQIGLISYQINLYIIAIIIKQNRFIEVATANGRVELSWQDFCIVFLVSELILAVSFLPSLK